MLRYASGSGAGVLHGNGRVLGIGFPIEMIVNPVHRNLLMERILQLMVPMPFQPTGPAVAGQSLNLAISFPGRSNFTYIAGTLAAVVGPILNGWVIDLTGRNYNMIFLVTPAFFVLAILCMLGVTQGEAKPQADL